VALRVFLLLTLEVISAQVASFQTNFIPTPRLLREHGRDD